MPFTEPANLHAEFARALQAHDLDALAAMYEEHAIQIAPDNSTISGPAPIRSMFEELLDSFTPSDGTQRFALVVDDISLTSTVYTFPAAEAAASGSTTMLTTEVSRRQADGSWRVIIDAPSFATYTNP